MKIIELSNGTKMMCGGEEDLTASDIEMDKRANAAIDAALFRAKVCGKPIARYDAETERAYLEYPDGRREYYGEKK